MSSIKQPDILVCGECRIKPKKGVTFNVCSGCAFVAYFCAACKLAAWPAHKGTCKEKKKANNAKSKETAAAAKAPVSGSGSGVGLRDMGSILVALNKTLPPKTERYCEGSLYNACHQGQIGRAHV